MHRVTPAAAVRLSSTMNMEKISREERRPIAPDRLGLWIALAIGLLLMLASVGRAEPGTATRVDRFNGTLKAGQTLHVENVSGDVIAVPGPSFSAVVTLTATAASADKANELLKKTQITSEHDDEGWSLETVLPGERPGRHDGNRHGLPCSACRLVARYELVVPPGVDVELETVSGDVRVRDLDGEASLESVNGSIEVRGAKKGLSLQTVNGRIDAAVARALPNGSDVSLQSVNGNVTLTLPKDARFEFSASTMNGTIASTFPLPPRASPAAVWTVPPETGKGKGRSRSRVVVEDEDGNRQELDLSELDQELADSMKEIQIQIENNTRDIEKQQREIEKQQRHIERQIRRIEIPNPQREYSGAIGKGGPDVRMETLNGKVLLLAAGTTEAEAKPLVSQRRSFVVTIPDVNVHVPPPAAPAPPAPPAGRAPRVPPPPPVAEEGDIVRGDIAGDFLSTSGGDYRVGRVSGRVQILTHSGEIRVAGAGAGADLKTSGGDISMGPVTGDLKATTLAGDIIVGPVSGAALADTKGGDIRIERVGGSLDARTSGGDIRVPQVGGGVRAASAGGEIRIGLAACDGRGTVTIKNDGGDVTLGVPAECKADVELVVTGVVDEDTAIRSDFPDLAVSRRNGVQRAMGMINGGGEKIQVRTTSGVIRLRKGTLS
jgi:DUF4097 and DUF4098 domain-containing protein YvlB